MNKQQFLNSCLPLCWHDDTRMNTLFLPFRNQAVNPDGWADKMNFWVNLITDYCHKTRTANFSIDELLLTFERNGRSPQCLATVLEYMKSQRNTMTLKDFSQSHQGKSWLGWGIDLLVYKPVTWGLSTVQNALRWNKQDDKYVIISVVEDLAAKVLEKHSDLVSSQWTDNIISLESLEEQCKDICSQYTLQLVLIQLQKEKHVLLFEENGSHIVKFRKKSENDIEPLTELDKGILRLQKARDYVQKEVDKAETDVICCTEEARTFVKSGQRNKAKASLKRRKRGEQVLQKKIAALDNIESILSQLQNAGSEKMVLDAYNAGVNAMKAATKGDLDLDKIDTTMADIEESLEEFSDVQQAISKPIISLESDTFDLEKELEEILAEEQPIAEKEIDFKPGEKEIIYEQDKKGIGFEQDTDDILNELSALQIGTGDVSDIAETQSPIRDKIPSTNAAAAATLLQ